MTHEDFNLFKRYLKERGIYKLFFKEVEKFPKMRHEEPIIVAINITPPTEAIMHFISWTYSEQGVKFWTHEYITYRDLYNHIIRLKNRNVKIDKDKLNEIFKEQNVYEKVVIKTT
jgi:hypothetical protein